MPKRKRNKTKTKSEKDSASATPTIAEVRRKPVLEVFVPHAGSRRQFTKNDCVFIVHDQMSNNRETGDNYFKMKVVSFHKDGDDVWLLGLWCYSPSDLEQLDLSERDYALITSLGKTELVVTDHLGVVDAGCIEDLCAMHSFDDKGTTGFPLKPDVSWFTRLQLVNWDKHPRITGINYHCVCRTLYDPVETVQRFCTSCKTWYDEGCMDRVGFPTFVQGATATEALQKVPYIRGWPRGWKPEASKDWMTVGTGVRHALVSKLADVINSDHRNLEQQWTDWEAFLGAEYLCYVRDTKFIHFSCLSCQNPI